MLCVALRSNSIFALCNINRLVFITEAESVYSAVRTEYSYSIKQIRFFLKGLIKRLQNAVTAKTNDLFRTRMQAAQHGGDNERHKSREVSVVEKFNEDEHRDITTCNENSAACFSKIRDKKKHFYLLQRYAKSAIWYRMTDNFLCLNKTGSVRINVTRRVRATFVTVGKR